MIENLDEYESAKLITETNVPAVKKKIESITLDTFFNGKIFVSQPANGYRFSIDSVVLAGLSSPQGSDKVLDLGTGCGIIPLILSHRSPALKLIGVELQPSLAAIAIENVRRNGMLDKISILSQDIKKLTVKALGGVVDYIISNPPYRPIHSGRINPDPQKAVARHELAMNLSQLMTVSRSLLRVGGRFSLIYPVERLVDVLFQMRQNDIEPKRVHMIFSKQNEPAKLVVIEGVRAGNPGIQEMSSFFIYRSNGQYTSAMAEFFKM